MTLTLDEFLEKRKTKSFTEKDIKDILEPCGYRCEWLNTQVTIGHTWKESGWSVADAQAEIYNETKGTGIPYHFAYIKFYEKDDQLFALVVGKTKADHPDFEFEIEKIKGEREHIEEMGADKAKAWLKRKEYDWHCQMVLVVWDPENQRLKKSSWWSPQAKRALTIEADIGGLLGLFSS